MIMFNTYPFHVVRYLINAQEIIGHVFLCFQICIAFATLNWLTDTSQERSDRVWALGIIGALTFIPGSYYVYVLSCIMLKRNGFTMDEIRRLG